MNFNNATSLLHKGKRVRLKKWHPNAYMYLEVAKQIDNKVLREPQKKWFPNGMAINSHLNYISAKGDITVGFTPYGHETTHGDWEEYVGD